MRRRRPLIRNLDADVHLELFLVAAVTAILVIRFYLRITGYPHLGGSSLHIAHVLWGGLMMMVAQLLLLTYLNRDAVRLMLDLGFPVDAPESNHGYRPLHNAAWCGDAALVELLLARGHPVDQRDPR